MWRDEILFPIETHRVNIRFMVRGYRKFATIKLSVPNQFYVWILIKVTLANVRRIACYRLSCIRSTKDENFQSYDEIKVKIERTWIESNKRLWFGNPLQPRLVTRTP